MVSSDSAIVTAEYTLPIDADGIELLVTEEVDLLWWISDSEEDRATAMLGVDSLPTFARPVILWSLLAYFIPFFWGFGMGTMRRWALFGILFMNWFGALWFDILLNSHLTDVAE